MFNTLPEHKDVYLFYLSNNCVKMSPVALEQCVPKVLLETPFGFEE